MSEEEILKECTELAENEHHELGDCWDEEYSSSAIFGLIMLYKQTKKEINNLKEIEQLHQEENGKLRVYLTKQDKMIELLIEDLQGEGCLNMSREEIDNYYERRMKLAEEAE